MNCSFRVIQVVALMVVHYNETSAEAERLACATGNGHPRSVHDGGRQVERHGVQHSTNPMRFFRVARYPSLEVILKPQTFTIMVALVRSATY